MGLSSAAILTKKLKNRSIHGLPQKTNCFSDAEYFCCRKDGRKWSLEENSENLCKVLISCDERDGERPGEMAVRPGVTFRREPDVHVAGHGINKMETWIGPVMKQMGTEPEFLIEFSQRGVESFQFQRMIDRTRLNRVRSIFQQLSVGVDLLRHANALPAFVARENNVLGDCDTLFTVVQHGEEDGCFASNCDRQRGYQLNVLSLPEQRPGATVVIEKRYDRNRCKNNGEVGGDGTVFSEVRQDRTRTKIHIGSNTFTSQTEMSRKMKAVKMNQDFIGQSYIRVELTGIEPATEELPNLTFEHVASLPYGDMLEHNFL
ncbi:uncharacterized protein LOC144473008 isoform X1 [Augochlora pura]